MTAVGWPEGILDDLRAAPDAGVFVVVDPDALLALPADVGEVEDAPGWADLRRAYELHGRRRGASLGRLVIRSTDSAVRGPADLPWDIERASTVAVVRFPGARQWIPLWRSLDETGRTRLAGLLERRPDPTPSDVARDVLGVVLPALDAASELDAVTRLRAGGALPAEAWGLVRGLVKGRLALALSSEPPDTAAVQTAWADWLEHGDSSPHHALLSAAGPAAVTLLASGLLRPEARTAAGLPAWVSAGATTASPAERARSLLDQRPADLSPATLDGWSAVAMWWGSVRAAIAVASPAGAVLREEAWSAWDAIDAAFRPWLKSSMGLLQTSSRPVPPTVERIAPFLARRVREKGSRVCLVVMDGMGFAQWPIVRDRLGLTVEETHGVIAVAPTLTPFSRQAIFAGALPSAFPESITTNAKERERWARFWAGEGLEPARVRYASTSGAVGSEIPALAGVDALGVAVLAVDDLLHGAKLVGDAEVAGALGVWLDHGWLRTLIERAAGAGLEVWITADHGNLEARSIDYLPQEGLAVDRTGERVRLYASETLRDASRADGDAWQPPGLPADGPFPLFAPGRAAYTRGSGPVVVHGGLSLDEVVVPLVRVTP